MRKTARTAELEKSLPDGPASTAFFSWMAVLPTAFADALSFGWPGKGPQTGKRHSPRPKQRRALSSARSSTYGKPKPSPSLRGHRHRVRTFKDATLCRLRGHRSNPALPHMKRAGRKESILFHAGERTDFPLIAFFFSASRSIHAVRQPSLGPSSPETAKSGLSQNQGRAAFRNIRPGPLFSGKAGPIFPAAWQSASGPHSLQRRPPPRTLPTAARPSPRERRKQESALSDGGHRYAGKNASLRYSGLAFCWGR